MVLYIVYKDTKAKLPEQGDNAKASPVSGLEMHKAEPTVAETVVAIANDVGIGNNGEEKEKMAKGVGNQDDVSSSV